MTGRFQGDLPERTYRFAGLILDVLDLLPNNQKGWIVARQLGRCGTSIGANIAEADEAISDAEFAAKSSIARKETSETRYWLRLCRDKLNVESSLIESGLREADEIMRILVTILRKMAATRSKELTR